jgi:plastocyanin
MKKFFLFLGVLMVLSMVLVACGGSSSGGTSTTVKVTMTDFAYDPNTITVSAGKDVNITLVNNGSVAHNFVVMNKPVTGSFTDADKANVFWQKDVPAGQTVTDKFTAPTTPGNYQVVCAVAGHFEAGMVATLVVK